MFTTNFDDVAEICTSDRSVQIVTPVSNASTLSPAKTPIYYLHGRALDLIEKRSPPGFVISESNYLDLKQNNASLYAAFMNEMQWAGSVFFIGYSLRDAEIARRILGAANVFHGKTVVICREDERTVSKDRLSKFGTVLSIGLKGLVEAFPPTFPATGTANLDNLAFVRKVLPEPAAASVEAVDVDGLIISGEFEYSKFAAQRSDSSLESPYCVDRSSRVDEVFSSFSGGIQRFLVSADIGNGKSVFMEQLAFFAHQRGFQVYRVESNLREITNELDAILAARSRYIIIIDDVIRYRQIAEYIGRRLTSLGMIVVSSRDTSEVMYSQMQATLGGSVREIDLNMLTDEELGSWTRLLERWGFWERKIELEPALRLQFLRDDCGREARAIVVSIFRSSRVADQISHIVGYFLGSKAQHRQAFLAILICSLCQKHVRWADVARWLDIDEQAFRRDLELDAVFDFVKGKREWFKLTSSQLADHIFRKVEFDQELIVDVYAKIVRETANSADDSRTGFEARENLKELMKFRFLTRLFADRAGARESVAAIYNRLATVKRIRENDQFWLQYAMSCLEVENILDAERYLNTALGIAHKKGPNYSDHQIQDQRVRMLFLKFADPTLIMSWESIDEATKLLLTILSSDTLDIIYPLRSVVYIERFLNERIDEIDIARRGRLGDILERMDSILTHEKIAKTKRGEVEFLQMTVKRAMLVLKNA